MPKCEKVYPNCICTDLREWHGLNFYSALLSNVHRNFATNRVCVTPIAPVLLELDVTKSNIDIHFGSKPTGYLYELLPPFTQVLWPAAWWTSLLSSYLLLLTFFRLYCLQKFRWRPALSLRLHWICFLLRWFQFFRLISRNLWLYNSSIRIRGGTTEAIQVCYSPTPQKNAGALTELQEAATALQIPQYSPKLSCTPQPDKFRNSPLSRGAVIQKPNIAADKPSMNNSQRH